MKVSCLLITLLIVVAEVQANTDNDDNGPAAARVNGQAISEFRLERYFTEYLQAQGRAVGSIRNPKAYKQLRQAALSDLIDKELLWQEATRRGLRISDELVKAHIDELRTAIGGNEVFARRLEDAGFDEDCFADYTRKELAAQQMYTELVTVKDPDEKQVREFFEAQRAAMARPEQIQARHILLKLAPDADAATVEASRQQLLGLRAQIVQGADFATLAKSQSQDSTASEGGDLGYFSHGKMVSEFETVAFAMQTGEVSQPVRTVFGWHLIQVQNHLAASEVEEAQGLALVRGYLARQQQIQAGQQALAQLRERNRIERIDDE